jgi:hypothetical protein
MSSLSVTVIETEVEEKCGICYICQDDQQLTRNRSPCDCRQYVHWNHLQDLCRYSIVNSMGNGSTPCKKCGICKTPLNVIWIRTKPSIRQFMAKNNSYLLLNLKIFLEYSLRYCYNSYSFKFYKNPVFWIHLLSFFTFSFFDYWIYCRNCPTPETGQIESVLPLPQDSFSSDLFWNTF